MTKLPFIEDSPENDICKKCGQELGPWWVSNNCACNTAREAPTSLDNKPPNMEASFDYFPEIDLENTISEIMLINLNEEDGT